MISIASSWVGAMMRALGWAAVDVLGSVVPFRFSRSDTNGMRYVNIFPDPTECEKVPSAMDKEY